VQEDSDTVVVRHEEGPADAVRAEENVDAFDVELRRVWRLANALYKSGLFRDVTHAEQAFGKIMLGRDLGLSPTQSLMVLDVVEGNVRVRSVQLAAWVRQHPNYDYDVVEHDDAHCVVEFFDVRPGPKRLMGGQMMPGEPLKRSLGASSFSLEDAKKAGLIKDHSRSPWRAHPRNMVWARAVSNGVRWFCPEVTGGIPVYTEADSFEEVRELTQGEGSGENPGWDKTNVRVAAEAERLIERAEQLGQGMYDRAIVQFALAGQSDERADEYLEAANEFLDGVEANQGRFRMTELFLVAGRAFAR
jgi:hypothetical protein